MRSLWIAGFLAVFAACIMPSAAHAGVPQCGSAAKYHTEACSIDTSLNPNALCNDGSIPAFWYRPGTGSGINTWVIWIGGGGNCESQASCANRVSTPGGRALISSRGFQATPGKGVTSYYSNINPMLYNANVMYADYCSSDTWTGSKRGTGTFDVNNSDTWNFEGRPIAISAVKSLMELAPSIQSATEIIIGGDSSGGIGITEVANDILPLLPASATKLFVNDAGFSLDIGQLDLNIASPYIYPDHPNAFEADVQQRLSYWNARGDVICDASATTPTQHANCYNSSYILQNGYIAIPSFVAQSQIDPSQVTQEECPTLYGNCPVSHMPTTKPGVYTTAFGAQMAALIVGAGTPASYTAYSPDTYIHVLLNDNTDFTTPLPFPQGNLAPRDVFDAWLANPTATRVLDMATGPGVE
jgi:hypothetical protein